MRGGLGALGGLRVGGLCLVLGRLRRGRGAVGLGWCRRHLGSVRYRWEASCVGEKARRTLALETRSRPSPATSGAAGELRERDALDRREELVAAAVYSQVSLILMNGVLSGGIQAEGMQWYRDARNGVLAIGYSWKLFRHGCWRRRVAVPAADQPTHTEPSPPSQFGPVGGKWGIWRGTHTLLHPLSLQPRHPTTARAPVQSQQRESPMQALIIYLHICWQG